MNKEITIVTAYFDIGRGHMKHFERSTDVYFDYFTKWAKLKNQLIVFVQDESIKKAVLDFRASVGLAYQTVVIVVEDIVSLAPEIFRVIDNAVSSHVLRQYRLRPESPDSCNALYNYVMVLKAWCMNYTANTLGYTGQLTWMDFGFNHGGTVYSLNSDFHVHWGYDFGDKITLFNLKPLDSRPIFDIVFSMDTYIMGSMIVVPDNLATKFWELAQYCTKVLAEVGISDDDQILWLMSARMAPECFNIKPVSGWHRALKEYGCGELILLEIPREKKIKTELRKVKKKLEAMRYALNIYAVASKWTQQ